MYVAVKGGEKAIAAAHGLLAEERRGPANIEEISLEQIASQLKFAVDRVMAEASLYCPRLAALAVKQAAGDLQEAVFLLRASRTTLPRFCSSLPMDTENMRLSRRISATWKDLPGGQILGSTFDYTHRLLDRSLETPASAPARAMSEDDLANVTGREFQGMPRAIQALAQEGLVEGGQRTDAEGDDLADCPDITREPLELPCDRKEDRPLRLQMLARADEGFLLGMAYSTQRGFGAVHPFTGELRRGHVEVVIQPEELDFPITIGEVEVTECDMVNRYTGKVLDPCFTRGYGLVFGNNERKALSMSLADRALRAKELGEEETGPAQNPEFMLMHGDNVDASGFVQHIKLPHYVDFQAELSLVRELKSKLQARREAGQDATRRTSEPREEDM